MTRRRASTPTGRRSPGALGTVEKLPSGRWRAFYRRDGRKFAAPTTFTTRAEGDAWLAGEFADRARGTWRDPDAARITLDEFASEWLATRADLAPKTRSVYQNALSLWILPRIGAGPGSRGVELGSMHVGDISPATVRSWYAAALTEARARIAGRRGGGDSDRKPHPARLWARGQGMPVSTTGRLSPAVLAEWESAGRPESVAPEADVPEHAGRSAVTHAYRLLRTVLNVATSDGLIDRNPCQIKGAGQTRSVERGTASPAEVAALAAHMPRRFAAAVTLAAWSGLRAGELFALARRHIDLDSRAVTVERAIVEAHGHAPRFGSPKTAKSQRTISLPSFVVEALRAHMAEFTDASPDALIFTTTGGGLVSSSRRSVLFTRARRAIGRDDLTWHDLRHTGATLAYRAGASVPEVQRRLGHTTMRAAQIYAHAADDSDRVLADRLDAMYAGAASAPRLRVV